MPQLGNHAIRVLNHFFSQSRPIKVQDTFKPPPEGPYKNRPILHRQFYQYLCAVFHRMWFVGSHTTILHSWCVFLLQRMSKGPPVEDGRGSEETTAPDSKVQNDVLQTMYYTWYLVCSKWCVSMTTTMYTCLMQKISLFALVMNIKSVGAWPSILRRPWLGHSLDLCNPFWLAIFCGPDHLW